METIKRQDGSIVGVIDRSPFARSGEVIVEAKHQNVVFPDVAVSHNMDRDFEVPYLTFKLTALAEGAVCDPQPNVLDRFIKVRALDASRGLHVGNSLPLVEVGEGVYRWTPPRPLLLRRGDSWSVCIDARETFDVAFDGKRKRIDAIRVEMTFEGELLMYAARGEYKKPFEGEAPLPG